MGGKSDLWCCLSQLPLARKGILTPYASGRDHLSHDQVAPTALHPLVQQAPVMNPVSSAGNAENTPLSATMLRARRELFLFGHLGTAPILIKLILGFYKHDENILLERTTLNGADMELVV